jgi:3-methyladenine DNA glycosylase/8-oxoguanine DNA glycosylase
MDSQKYRSCATLRIDSIQHNLDLFSVADNQQFSNFEANQYQFMEISITTPREFNFKRTVISHGWCELLPFQVDRENWVLTRTLDLKEGRGPQLGSSAAVLDKPVTLTITATARKLLINTSRRLSEAATQKVVSDVRHMLRLDDDIGEFYRLLADDADFNWIPTQGAGRLLRSPTVFEDLVKMICTTNCSWALTEKMVTGLVENLGRESKNGHRTFPTPEAMALMPVKFYVNEVRAGYRAEYLKQLADRVASGALDVEAWLTSPLSTAELVKEMRGVKGVGPYAAENVLKLLGRYDGLALDSWTRTKFFSVRNNGRKTTDKNIECYYSRFKEWRGLALWCDMTRDWLDGQ